MYMNRYFNPFTNVYFEKSDDGGGGSADGDGEQPKVVIDGSGILPEEVKEKLKRTAEKSGGFEDFAEILYNENKQLRDKLRDSEGNGLKKGQVAVPKEVKEHYEKIKELGGFDEVVEKVENYDEVKNERDQMKRKERMKKVAGVYGYNADVLNDLTEGYEVEQKKATDGDGNETVKAFIKTDDGEVELSNWIDENKSMYKPSLQNTDKSTNGSRRRITSQNSSEETSSSGSSVIDEWKKKRDKREEEREVPEI